MIVRVSNMYLKELLRVPDYSVQKVSGETL